MIIIIIIIFDKINQYKHEPNYTNKNDKHTNELKFQHISLNMFFFRKKKKQAEHIARWATLTAQRSLQGI